MRGLAAKIEEYRRNIDTAHDQSERIAGALEDARAELETINEQTAHTGLQDALEIRAARKRCCTRRASNSTTSPRACVTPTKRALPPSVRCSRLRERINELQLKEQAARISGEQFVEQLQAAGVDEAELQAKLTPDMKPSYLQGEVTRLSNAITALGPVNMAALDELAAASERKQFLDAQSADLTRRNRHAGRCDPQDRPGNARAAARHLRRSEPPLR